MDYLIVIFVSLFASGLTLISGFGLGTLLLPTFTLLFGIELAIVLTAIVHFLNNIFKTYLMRNSIDWKIIFSFGIPALIFSYLGASLFVYIAKLDISIVYRIFDFKFETSYLNLLIGLLIFVFAIFDLIPKLQELKIDRKLLPIGGILSGFFGGLSGHQGALRSTFLIKSGMTKEFYIGTGIAISLLVDISRIFVYGAGRITSGVGDNLLIVILAILSAFIGAIFGKKMIKKITITFIRYVVGIMLLLTGTLLMIGII